MIESDQTKDFFSRRIKQDEVMIEESSREESETAMCERECRKIVYMISCNAHHLYSRYIIGMLRTNSFSFESWKFFFVCIFMFI